jgi:protein-L-isoaspartate(D-aspartate) O-methyltransferase
MIKLWNRNPSERDLAIYADRRRRMVEDQIRSRGLANSELLEAMTEVPRHAFVPPDQEAFAYEDRALPIGLGQTISQPYMVAIMTDALDPAPGTRVLEIGTGSGYQAALLAHLGSEVWTIERLPAIALRAETILKRLGIEGVHCRTGDGTLGWPEEAPFEGIIVTAGSPDIPPSLKRQLADGGRLVIPTGSWSLQELVMVERRGDDFLERRGGACAFVPLVGEEGWNP